MGMTDKEFMTWIHDRLVKQLDADPNSTFLLKYRAIVAKMSDTIVTPVPEPGQREKPMAEKTVFSLDQDLTFGKYKGETLEEVIDDNPSYIWWALDEVEFFDIDDKAREYLGDET